VLAAQMATIACVKAAALGAALGGMSMRTMPSAGLVGHRRGLGDGYAGCGA